MKLPWRLLSADGQRLLLAVSLAVVAHGTIFAALEVINFGRHGDVDLSQVVQNSIAVALHQEVISSGAPAIPPVAEVPPVAVQQSSQNDSAAKSIEGEMGEEFLEGDISNDAAASPLVEKIPPFPQVDQVPSVPQTPSSADEHTGTSGPGINRAAPLATREVSGQPAPLSPSRYIPPSYPEAARLGGTEGVVHLRFTIDNRGRPAEIVLEHSSGSTILDQEAIRTARLWRFPRDYAGRETVHRIVFRLE